MRDITVVTSTKSKDELYSVKCPMLNSTNYTVWTIRMKNLLKVQKVWSIIEETDDDEKNNRALALLFQAIPEALILQVGEMDTMKKDWDAIKTKHVGA